jgi:hypothetical protein
MFEVTDSAAEWIKALLELILDLCLLLYHWEYHS